MVSGCRSRFWGLAKNEAPLPDPEIKPNSQCCWEINDFENRWKQSLHWNSNSFHQAGRDVTYFLLCTPKWYQFEDDITKSKLLGKIQISYCQKSVIIAGTEISWKSLWKLESSLEKKNWGQLKTIVESQMRHKYGTFRDQKNDAKTSGKQKDWELRNSWAGFVDPRLTSGKEKSWSLIKGQWSHCASFHMSLNISGHLVCNFHQPRKLQNPAKLFWIGRGKRGKWWQKTTTEAPIAAFVAVRVPRSLWNFKAGPVHLGAEERIFRNDCRIAGWFQSIPNIGIYFSS